MSSPVLLSTVNAIGLYGNLPTVGIPGRRYFATDTGQEWYDTGLSWVRIQPAGTTVSNVSISSPAPGNFIVAHSLGIPPSAVVLQMTSGGLIWFQSTPFDAFYLYLTASDTDVTAIAACFH
jgi:hypothetical protein